MEIETQRVDLLLQQTKLVSPLSFGFPATARPYEVAFFVADQFALVITHRLLHFGNPHHEMDSVLTLAAPIIFRVAGLRRHRDRGKA